MDDWRKEFQYLLDRKILSRDELAYLFGQIDSIVERRIRELEDVCRNALTSLTITMLPRLDDNVASNSDIIKVVISSLEQALKEKPLGTEMADVFDKIIEPSEPKLCICCEEITKENAHLHRNCGK